MIRSTLANYNGIPYKILSQIVDASRIPKEAIRRKEKTFQRKENWYEKLCENEISELGNDMLFPAIWSKEEQKGGNTYFIHTIRFIRIEKLVSSPSFLEKAGRENRPKSS